MTWEKFEIGNFVELRQGLAINKSTQKYLSNEVTYLPLLRIGDMKDGNFNVFINDSVPEKFIAKESDIIYTRTGKVGLVFRKQYGVIHNNCFTVSSKDESILIQEFLYYVLQEKSFYEEALSRATGAAQPDLPHGAFSSIEIFLPPIDKQKNIVEILNAYNDLIENNQKQIKLLEEAAQRLYKEWFVDLRFPGYETTPIIDGVPEGWKKKKLVKVFDYVRGKSYSSKEIVENGKTLLINLKNIRAFGGYNRNAEKCYIGKYSDSQKLQAGDIVMGVTDMTQERRLVGHVAVVPDLGKDMIFSMDLIKLIPLTVEKSFLYSVMFYGGYSKQIAVLANGTNVLHLKPESMMSMEMLVPSNEIMSKYDDKFKNFYKKIELLENQNTILAEARDRLLPKLLSGELEV